MKDKIYQTVTECRICYSKDLSQIIDLGSQPPANSLYKKNEPVPDNVPLVLKICNTCLTVQLGEDVSPEYLFNEYLWVTGTSKGAEEYSLDFCSRILSKFDDYEKLFVVEVASNDGTFLKKFQDNGCKVLGVDPAKNIAKIANENGVETIPDFFSTKISKKIINDNGHADIVFARNVIPHVKDIHSVIDGMYECLAVNGIGAIEFHNVQLLLRELHYDYIYHEHLFYFSLRSINNILLSKKLNIFDIDISPISGGSWVVYFSKAIKKKSKRFEFNFKSIEKK